MRKRVYKHYIELMPAAYLLKRKPWQRVVHSLPIGACLLVSNLKDKEQSKLMQMLSQSFREKGKQVVIWTVR
jgi:hypothetical protein